MLTPVSTNTMTITIAKAITNYNDYNNNKDFNNNNNFYNKKLTTTITIIARAISSTTNYKKLFPKIRYVWYRPQITFSLIWCKKNQQYLSRVCHYCEFLTSQRSNSFARDDLLPSFSIVTYDSQLCYDELLIVQRNWYLYIIQRVIQCVLCVLQIFNEA